MRIGIHQPAETSLDSFSLGDVPDHRQQIAIRHHGRNHIRGKGRAVLAPEQPLTLVIGFGLEHAQRRPDVLDLRRGHDVGSVHADEFIAAMPKHPAEARVGVEVIALGIGDHDAVRCILKKRAIARFTRLQGFLRLLLLGNILHIGPDAADRSVLLPDQPVLDEHRKHRTILATERTLESLGRYLAAQFVADRLLRNFGIGGDFPDLPSQQFLGPVTQHVQFGLVDASDPALRIHLVITERGLVEQGLELLLAPAQRRLSPDARGDIAIVGHNCADCRIVQQVGGDALQP